MTGDDAHKAIVRRMVAAQNAEWSGGPKADLSELVTADRRYHTETDPTAATSADTRNAGERAHDAWARAHHTIEQLIADGDWVVAIHSVTAIHSGTYWGVPATGRQVAFRAVFIHRFRDGKIAETWRFAHDIGRILAIGGIVGTPGQRTPL